MLQMDKSEPYATQVEHMNGSDVRGVGKMRRSIRMVFFLILCSANLVAFAQGLEIRKPGTKLAYIARNGKPLLAFGCHLEHMFLRDNDLNYTVWSRWAQAHGINHCRVRVIQPKRGDTYKPYQSSGEGRYDLTRFDPVFWDRFRAICVNLRDHGIVVHLLVFPHNGHVRDAPWRDSLFNPAHNVNAETKHLGGSNHYQFWHSVADQQRGLWEIQRAAVVKIAELTADLDNVYYDLSHEFRTDSSGAQPTDWNKAKSFFEAVADTLRTTYARLQPGKRPLIGLDAEHFAKAGQREWNFSHPAFDLMILGNSSISPVPSVATVAAWREQFKKPFLLQEGGADDDRGGKLYIGYHGTDPAIIRKYVWKWIMAKNQFIGFYQKEYAPDRGYPDNYNPNGHSRFEDDALMLRGFWDSLTDYGSLDYAGRIASGPGFRKMVLSSEREAIAYMASEMGRVGTEYRAQRLELMGLSLRDGSYTADIWKPAAPGGLVETVTCTVSRGSTMIFLPAFTDDLAVHLYPAASVGRRRYVPADIIASKGGRAEHPESTLYAYDRNLRAGVSLDMDIRKTADGDIVVLHDKTTGRTCDKDWLVAEKTVAELKTLDAAHHFDPGGDRTFPLRGKGIAIPTLDEALALFAREKRPGAIVWIDTKDDETYPFEENQGLYDRLIALIAGHNLWQEAHVEVATVREAEALRTRDSRVRLVFWAPDVRAAREAIRYPHYLRIGVRPNVASLMHQEIKASGKLLFMALNEPMNARMNIVAQVQPDSIGTDKYSELLTALVR